MDWDAFFSYNTKKNKQHLSVSRHSSTLDALNLILGSAQANIQNSRKLVHSNFKCNLFFMVL